MAELYHFDKVGPETGTRIGKRTASAGTQGAKQPSATPASANPAAIEPVKTPEKPAEPKKLTVEEAVQAALKDALPGLGSLHREERRSLLIQQVKHDLPDVWTQTEPNTADAFCGRIDTAASGDVSAFCSEIAAIHTELLEGLTVADFRLGKSYGLGRALAETVLIPCAVGSGRSVAGFATESDKEKGKAFMDALLGELEGGRVYTIQAWLLDLRDWFSDCAADAVVTTLGGWSFWMIRPTIGDQHVPVDWDDAKQRGSLERALRRQGDMWRGLLSGEKDPDDIVSANFYFAAMASVVKRVAGLALQFLGTTIGLLLFLGVVVAGLALYISSTSTTSTGTLPAVIALLAALGVTTGSVGAAVQKAWSKAEGPLWAAEKTAAIANAAWEHLAPMGSVESIQLLLAVGEKADPRTETMARHPNLFKVRNIPMGRLGIVLIVVSTAIALFAADAGHLNRDASFFLPPLCLVALLAAIDGWDLLIGVATKQSAPYLALPERIQLPSWTRPVAQVLAPVFLVIGLLAGHFLWH
jgi:hypothetical protein